MAKLGIIAGAGALPRHLISACRAAGRDCFVVGLEGHADPRTIEEASEHGWVRLGAGGRALAMLREAGVEALVFAGAVRRPSMAELRPDARTARFFAKIGLAAVRDGALMNAIARELEVEGFRVIGPEAVLGGLLAQERLYSQVAPDDAQRADIERGVEVARALGAADVGQAVVVEGGVVLGVEAIEGTSALIARCAALARSGGGVLVKVAKPIQDRRIDLPTIGLETVAAAATAGLAGVAVEAEGALIVERELMVAEADRAGLFVVGVRVAR